MSVFPGFISDRLQRVSRNDMAVAYSASPSSSSMLFQQHSTRCFHSISLFSAQSHVNFRPRQSQLLATYEQFENVLNILLSAPYPNAWVAMGFSTNGMMVTFRAMIGWLKSDQTGIIHQYYLGGKSSSAITVDKINGLDVVPSTTRVHYQGSMIHFSFQLPVEGPVETRNIIFAYGSSVPANTQLSIHKDKFSTAFDFSTGRSSSADSVDSLEEIMGP